VSDRNPTDPHPAGTGRDGPAPEAGSTPDRTPGDRSPCGPEAREWFDGYLAREARIAEHGKCPEQSDPAYHRLAVLQGVVRAALRLIREVREVHDWDSDHLARCRFCYEEDMERMKHDLPGFRWVLEQVDGWIDARVTVWPEPPELPAVGDDLRLLAALSDWADGLPDPMKKFNHEYRNLLPISADAPPVLPERPEDEDDADAPTHVPARA
jgi:hypothetical protein